MAFLLPNDLLCLHNWVIIFYGFLNISMYDTFRSVTIATFVGQYINHDKQYYCHLNTICPYINKMMYIIKNIIIVNTLQMTILPLLYEYIILRQ